MTHCDQLLQVLSDGRPHDHRQLYALGMIVHSRVADLRDKGHTILCWRDGDTSYYQLDKSGTGIQRDTGHDGEPSRDTSSDPSECVPVPEPLPVQLPGQLQLLGDDRYAVASSGGGAA